MIKDLVKDLTYDNITLDQALMRAKLIAFEIGNQDLKNWITKELNGYSNGDALPAYRIIPCDIYATLGGFRGTQTVPFDLTNLDEDLNGKMYKMNVQQSISILESSLQAAGDNAYGFEELPVGLVNLLREMSGEENLITVKRRVQFSQLTHIVNLTKQKLIDTLLELNTAFPNLENHYTKTEANNELAKTIINNHIYGANSSSNIGLGTNVSQTISNTYKEKSDKFISELKSLGVPWEDLEKVQEIIHKESGSVNFGKSMISWAGSLANKAIEKGIELQIPLILDKLQEFL